MKYLITLCLLLAACYAEEPATIVIKTPNSPTLYQGNVEFSDDYGYRIVDSYYYYDNTDPIYWDSYFGAWIGSRGYWLNNRYYSGFYPGYHEHYNHNVYHNYRTIHGTYATPHNHSSPHFHSR